MYKFFSCCLWCWSVVILRVLEDKEVEVLQVKSSEKISELLKKCSYNKLRILSTLWNCIRIWITLEVTTAARWSKILVLSSSCIWCIKLSMALRDPSPQWHQVVSFIFVSSWWFEGYIFLTLNRFAQESLEEASVELSSPSSPNSSMSMQVPFCFFTRVLFHKQHSSIHLYVSMDYHHRNEMIIHICLKCL